MSAAADFLSAICACATSVGDVLIKDLIIEDYADLGLYGVKFFVMGKWITVAVDDLFPTKATSATYSTLLFASPRTDSPVREIWPMIMEKAWAKLHGSYESTDAGDNYDALQYLTGGVVRILKLCEAPDPADLRFFKDLAEVLKENDGEDAFVGCGRVGYKRDMVAAPSTLPHPALMMSSLSLRNVPPSLPLSFDSIYPRPCQWGPRVLSRFAEGYPS